MRFMITFTWKEPPNEEVMALMPAEEARGKELGEQGIAEAPEIAADMSMIWVVWNCSSQDQVQELLETLPLYKYLNIAIVELAPKQ